MPSLISFRTLNLNSQQKENDKRLSNKTMEHQTGDENSNIKPESIDDKESLDKQPDKKMSKFSIVNLLFNR